mmetsp:Transcript_25743/g.40314  ORF Transcript_25743/g.40314 Transcript_25743/m.40314 type:complete len:181 (+) Transcript_25743:1254-1796(+)
MIMDPDSDLDPGLVVRVGPLYNVRHGDTLANIAAQFSTTVKKLLSVNPHIAEREMPPEMELLHGMETEDLQVSSQFLSTSDLTSDDRNHSPFLFPQKGPDQLPRVDHTEPSMQPLSLCPPRAKQSRPNHPSPDLTPGPKTVVCTGMHKPPIPLAHIQVGLLNLSIVTQEAVRMSGLAKWG